VEGYGGGGGGGERREEDRDVLKAEEESPSYVTRGKGGVMLSWGVREEGLISENSFSGILFSVTSASLVSNTSVLILICPTRRVHEATSSEFFEIFFSLQIKGGSEKFSDVGAPVRKHVPMARNFWNFSWNLRTSFKNSRRRASTVFFLMSVKRSWKPGLCSCLKKIFKISKGRSLG
jgi:hypothetical protein